MTPEAIKEIYRISHDLLQWAGERTQDDAALVAIAGRLNALCGSQPGTECGSVYEDRPPDPDGTALICDRPAGHLDVHHTVPHRFVRRQVAPAVPEPVMPCGSQNQSYALTCTYPADHGPLLGGDRWWDHGVAGTQTFWDMVYIVAPDGPIDKLVAESRPPCGDYYATFQLACTYPAGHDRITHVGQLWDHGANGQTFWNGTDKLREQCRINEPHSAHSWKHTSTGDRLYNCPGRVHRVVDRVVRCAANTPHRPHVWLATTGQLRCDGMGVG